MNSVLICLSVRAIVDEPYEILIKRMHMSRAYFREIDFHNRNANWLRNVKLRWPPMEANFVRQF